jgi:PKD repeat protein
MEMMPRFKITPVSPVFMLVLAITGINTRVSAGLKDTTLQVAAKSFIGQRDAKILNYAINIPVANPKTVYNITKFYFSTRGCTDIKDITAAHLYFTGAIDYTNLPMAGADTVSSIIKSPNGSMVFYTNKQMHSGNNYFLLTYDVSNSATIGDLLDATLDSVVAIDTLRKVTSGNPKGNRYIDAFGTYCNTSVSITNSQSPQYIGLRNVKIGKSINNASQDLDRLTSYQSLKIAGYRQETYPVEIKYGQGNKEQIIAWADWNNDGIFDPGTEQVFYTPSAVPGETYYTGITIPCSATPGYHVLRIMDDIDTMPKLTPCGKSRFGEAEEYIIQVLKDVIPSTASFSFDNHTIRGSQVNFTNTSVVHGNYKCQWCFTNSCLKGGNFDAEGNTVSFGWINSGTYTVKMALTWAGCDSTVVKTDTATVFIDKSGTTPVPAFVASDNIADTTTIIQLNDLSSNKPAGWIWTISPSVLNGKPAYSFLNGTNFYSQNPVLKFHHDGAYDVTLNANNFAGQSAITKKGYINIIGNARMCDGTDTLTTASGFIYDDGGRNHPYGINKSCFVVIKPPCATAVNISFRSFDVSTLGPGGDNLKIFDSVNNLGVPLHARYRYNNGFRNISPGNVPTIPPTVTAGSGTAYLQWTTDSSFVGDGFAAYWTSVLRTSKPPKAAFSAPDSVYIHHVAKLVNNSTGPELRNFWDLNGDGTIDNSDQSPVYRFDSAGLINVRLIVQNCGGVDTVFKKISVRGTPGKPVAAYSINYNRLGVGDQLQFFDHSTNYPYKWKWIIIPPNNNYNFRYVNSADTSQNPVVEFNGPGNYTISLVAYNEHGQDTITKTDVVGVDDYCIPIVKLPVPSVGISRVVITDRQNDTILDRISAPGVAGYTAFHSLTPTPLVEDGRYTITVFRDTDAPKINGIMMLDYSKNDSFKGVDDTLAFIQNIQSKSWSSTFTMRRIGKGVGRLRVGVGYYNQAIHLCGVNNVAQFNDYNVILQVDTTPPVITLKGKDTIVVEKTRAFSDPGATVYDAADGDITYALVVAGTVNTAIPGIYPITYDAMDKMKLKAKEVTRIVKVIGDTTRPDISLWGDAVKYIEVFNSYFEDSAFVVDNIDTGLTLKISGKVDTAHTGTYFISYTSIDYSGNIAVKYRKVVIMDTIAPVITLKGKKTDKLQLYSSYIDSGFTATDNYNHTLTLKKTGKIDSSKRGIQNIFYSATDSAGNRTIVKRIVRVDDYIPPTLSFASDTIYWDINKPFIDPPALISDNYYHLSQGNLHRVEGYFVNVNKLGYYTMKYFAQDSSGNNSKIDSIVVKVIDRIPPQITLSGDTIVYLKQWQRYWDLQYSITDNNVRGADPVVIETGDYSTAEYPYIYFKSIGLHLVNYKCVDQSGNISQSVVRFFYVSESAVEQGAVNGISFNYYPNPVKDNIHIDFKAPQSGKITLEIADMLGRPVKSIFSGKTDELHLESSVSDLPPGIYLLHLSSGEINSDYRMIIER